MATTTTTTTTTTNSSTPLQSSNPPTSSLSPHQSLSVDFSWKNFKSLISTRDTSPPQPLYSISYKSLKPHLVFKSAIDDSTFGTGTIHAVSIDADCEVRGRRIKIKALKRWRTEYAHLSYTFNSSSSFPSSTDPNIETNTSTSTSNLDNQQQQQQQQQPVKMTWTSSSGWKTWDFICLDASQMPVAKFSANTLSLRNVGCIEFLGKEAMGNEGFREEIVVVGLTLMYTMFLRMTSVLSLVGAVFARPGWREEGRGEERETGKGKGKGKGKGQGHGE
ncbi:hypothetical protein OCU04_003135 [Sclerotinia nivalis]|uniref:Uncharacterized protein n=1 Tax=Sclerotinia nivalis TaxID=352851 RepID=A0A9X0DPT9_9HELO|nr:hypothetical protein OCU04_003135 [Sclerotinia nivalis]